MTSAPGQFLSALLLFMSLTVLENRSFTEELIAVGVGVSVNECRRPLAWSPESPQREHQ